MITLSNVELRRGIKVLLDDAELVVHPGQHIGIIGGNGTGKSSLFKLLLGQIAPDAGDLFIPANWRIAHMAQELANSEHSAVDYVLDGDPHVRAIEKAIEQALLDEDNDRLAWNMKNSMLPMVLMPIIAPNNYCMVWALLSRK